MEESDTENEILKDTTPNSKINNNKNKGRGRKRKRISSTSSGEYVLPENTLEVEKNLQASALKNNLDDASVKKILKKVVTNDHVLALMKLREEEEDSSTDEDISTLTRSKAKTVKKVPRVTAPWNLQLNPIEHIPVKTRPEVEALIAQELPDDEDDEEYEPTNDDIPSDDDHILESCSDLESQPRTPATPKTQSEASPKVMKDGPFKVPQEVSKACRQLHLEEEATIALRTRSKLSLSSTPIEHIESSFVPPDEPPVPDVDEIWNDFLKECLNPAATAKHEDDDETDPEYNVAADPDANEDEEGLENSIIKISKKELEDILTELCQVIPGQPSGANSPATHNTAVNKSAEVVEMTLLWDGKKEVLSDEEQQQTGVAAKVLERQSTARISIGKSEPVDEEEMEQQAAYEQTVEQQAAYEEQVEQQQDTHIQQEETPRNVTMAVEEEVVQLLAGEEDNSPAIVRFVTNQPTEVVRVDLDENVRFLPEQILLLQQQLRQHVQLAATSFLQLCVHPKHWTRAAAYREYLESLNSIADSRPSSVVNVCNLKPAVELINVYEKSVTEVTPENAKMVEFIAEEMEKIETRSSHKYLYRGNFPEVFKKVVASSSVFLYPYLLPPAPFRPEPARKRFSYLRCEDELIALGLDQFWWYVEHNPELFPGVGRGVPRGAGRGVSRGAGAGRGPVRVRRGLQAATQLVCQHMMPWMATKTLTSHIACVRKTGDKNNPINKFLRNRTVEPVKHKLLPFNPKLTLYEQPEHEMPRMWVVYLAKTSKRFRSYLYRRAHLTGVPPEGVELDMEKTIPVLEKTPLPSDFTDIYKNNRVSNGSKYPNDKDQNNQTPNQTIIIDSHVFNVVSTQDGVLLVPASQTNTVDTNKAPISTPTEIKPKNTITIDSGCVVNNIPNKPNEIKIMKKPEVKKVQVNLEEHCKCCILLRKICRVRQTTITEYLKNSKSKKKSCPCREVKYPRMSNKMKLLLRYYWTFSKTMYHEVKNNLEELGATTASANNKSDSEPLNEEKDMAFVLSFIMKLAIRMNMTRTVYSKKRIDELLSTFDIDKGNPLYLAADLHKLIDCDDICLYKEFMCFLTAEQADRLEKFRDYFIGNCMEDLMKKIEENIPDREKRCVAVETLGRAFVSASAPAAACDLCCQLLSCFADAPHLAHYTFHLFPHRRKQMETNKNYTGCDNEKNTNTPSCNIANEKNTSCNIENEKNTTSCNIENEKNTASCNIENEKNNASCNIDNEENTASCNIENGKNNASCNIENEKNTASSNIEKEKNTGSCNIENEKNTASSNIDNENNTTNCNIENENNTTSCNIENENNTSSCNIENENNTSSSNIENEKNTANCNIENEKNTANYNTENNSANMRKSPVRCVASPKITRNKAKEKSARDQNPLSNENGTSNGTESHEYECGAGGVPAGDLIICEESRNTQQPMELDPCTSDERSDDDEENGGLRLTYKEEPIDTDELTITETEVQCKNLTDDETYRMSEDSEASIRIVIEQEVIKNEPPEWKREEDKLILEIIKQSLSEEAMKNKTVIDIIDSKSEILSECFDDKSLNDIKERVVHLLQFVNRNK